jgi:hypothetical protein
MQSLLSAGFKASPLDTIYAFADIEMESGGYGKNKTGNTLGIGSYSP